MTDCLIRLLGRGDEPAFRRVRLDALRLHPTAFSSSYEDDLRRTPDELALRLLAPPAYMFGAFDSAGALVGTAGLRRQVGAKIAHKGTIFAVYVDAGQRRGGLARALVEAAVDAARDARLRTVQLSVTLGNDAARRLYVALGFRSYGIEQRGVCVEGVLYDEELMALALD